MNWTDDSPDPDQRILQDSDIFGLFDLQPQPSLLFRNHLFWTSSEFHQPLAAAFSMKRW